MSNLYTLQLPLVKLSQATLQTAAATSPLIYSGTWATGGQNPAVWPSTNMLDVPLEANGCLLFFAIADTADDSCRFYLWAQPSACGPNINLFSVDVQAGTSVLSYSPGCPATALTNFFWADTITSVANYANTTIVSEANNGIGYCKLDLLGMDRICGCWDIDIGSGTDGTDGICWVKWY